LGNVFYINFGSRCFLLAYRCYDTPDRIKPQIVIAFSRGTTETPFISGIEIYH
jgi:hypothetical protein